MTFLEALQPIEIQPKVLGGRTAAKTTSTWFAAAFSGDLTRERLEHNVLENHTFQNWAGDGVNAWAGATPVLGGVLRPIPRASASGVAPAHAYSISS